jgi:arylsulfatase A-like enzyme
MVWVFPEYGGQVAVQLGDLKAVRRGLATPQPGPWELYDLARDSGETRNLAAERPDVIRAAEDVLRREMQPNRLFPVSVPGLAAAGTP